MIPPEVERYIDVAGEHRWRFRVDNGNILADSGEGYANEADMESSLAVLWPDDEALAAALAVLTLITGEDWDRQKLLDHSATLRDVALHTLKRQGLTDADAESFVEERWKAYASDIPQEPTATLPVEQVLSAASESGPITPQIPQAPDMAARLAEYQARKAENPDPLQGPGSVG